MSYPIVSVVCTSYNHEQYIRECLDGIVMQRVDFRFEVIVHDDASTDSSADIIREYAEKYPDIIKSILQTENQYSKGVQIWEMLFKMSNSKYIAICECDDYWTDPSKLQKQVDFLEANPNYGLVFGSIRLFDHSAQKFIGYTGDAVDSFDSLLIGNTVTTLTTMFRRDLYLSYVEEINPASRNWKMADYPLWLYIAHRSKIKFFAQEWGVYRMLQNSASHSINKLTLRKFELNAYEIPIFYAEKYNVDHTLLDIQACWIKFQIYALESTKEKLKELRLEVMELSKIHSTKKIKLLKYGFYYPKLLLLVINTNERLASSKFRQNP